jgi:hypothetical protein
MIEQFLDFQGCTLFKAPTDPLKLRWAYDGKTLRFFLVGPARPADVVTWAATPFVHIG